LEIDFSLNEYLFHHKPIHTVMRQLALKKQPVCIKYINYYLALDGMMKKKTNTIFSMKNVLSLFFVLLMATSIFAIWQGGSSGDSGLEPYKKHAITIDGSGLVIESAYGNVYGYTYPSELESIGVDTAFLEAVLASDEIVVLFDPDDAAIDYIDTLRSQLALRDVIGLGKTTRFAITTESDVYAYDVLDCTTVPIVLVYMHTVENAVSQIYQQGNCLVLEAGSSQDLVRVKDRFVYTSYDIME
jgi:hypothetical protein